MKQWFWLLLAFPWMFIGAVGDFAFPDLIGRLMNAIRDGDSDEFRKQMITWVIIIMIGAVGTALTQLLFNIIAERIGNQVRKDLFAKLITLDTAFFDEARTGDLRKYYITLSSLFSFENQL